MAAQFGDGRLAVRRLRRPRRRSKVERLSDRGDVPRLVRLLKASDWLIDSEGHPVDLEVPGRIEAVTALGTIDAQEAENGIIRGLRDDDPRVRLAAVQALRPEPSIRAAKVLAVAAAGWRDPRMSKARQAAIDLLVELADELFAVEFAEALVPDGCEPLTDQERSAVRALFMADSGPVAELFADQLVSRLGTTDELTGRAIVQTLVAMNTVGVPSLISALDDPERRPRAATALGAIRDIRAVPKLVGLLADRDATVRAAAARALGEIRDPAALEALVRASGDPDPAVRDAALEACDLMRGVVVAMLGAAALSGDTGNAHTLTTDVDAPVRQLPAPSVDQRTFLQRLLGRSM